MDPENIEMEDFNPNDDITSESQIQKDLEETSFTENIQRTLYDRVLEMDGSENLFVRPRDDIEGRLKDLLINKKPSTSKWDPKAVPNAKRDAGVIKRQIIYDKKQFIDQVFGIKVNKGAGPYSKMLYSELKTTTGEKSGKINGATYKGKKFLILMKGGRMEYSKSKVNAQLILEFKNNLDKALAEHNVTPASIVEDHISHEISEETVDNIVKNAANDMDFMANNLLDAADHNPLTPQEIRELLGVMSKNWDKLMEDGGEDLVRANINSLDIEKQDLKRKALDARGVRDAGREEVYNTMAKAVELKADAGRLKINQKPKGNLGAEILNEEADVNEMSKFDKFKKWAKKNLLGLSAITITIAGILVTIFSAARTVIKGGASALSKFAKAVASIAQKFGPIIAAVGSVLASILMAGTKGLLWLAKNLWLLAVALAYFIYNEYNKKKKEKKLNKMDVTKKSLINDLYNAALVAVGVVGVSMGSRKLFGDSLGISSGLSGFGKLSFAIGTSVVGVKMLQEKGYLPKEVDK